MAFKPAPLLTLVAHLVLAGCLVGAKTPSVDQAEADPHDLTRLHLSHFEKFLKNHTKAAFKMALPRMMVLGEKVNLSSRCQSSLMKYVVALKQIKVWAMRMFDASAKIPSGFFSGTVTEFGAFDQCLKILVKNRKGVEDFRGQYCSVEAMPNLGPRPRNLSMARIPDVKFDDSVMKEMQSIIYAFYQLTLRFGICVPSTCTAEDMRAIGTEVVKPLNYGFRVSKCHVSEEVEVEPVQIVVLCFLILLLFMLTGGTFLEWYEKEEFVENKKRDPAAWQTILLCFSLQSNLRRLCARSSDRAGEMHALHGIRALSMTWVVLGHTYVWVNFQTLRSSITATEWFNSLEFEAILNGWLSVSSFIFLSGLLTTYNTLQYLRKTGGKMNIFVYIFRRFLRLYPSLLLLLGGMFFLPWITSGPFWHELPGVEVANCRENWWTNLLFINNFGSITKMCMQHSWYLSADIQLHIIALFILIPMYRNAYLGAAICFILTASGCIAVGIITYIKDYDPTIMVSRGDLPMALDIAEDIHIKTFTYFGPYCIGVMIGYCLLKCPKVQIGSVCRVIGWVCAFLLAVSSVYGVHQWNTGYFPIPEVTALYAAMHRTTFILAVAWVAFDTISSNSGLVSSLLKSQPFVVMSRLTFMAYLVQGPVIWTRYGSLKERFYYSHFNLLYEFFGNLVLSLAIAFGGHMLVEAPFANMERRLFSGAQTHVADTPPSVLCQVKTSGANHENVKDNCVSKNEPSFTKGT